MNQDLYNKLMAQLAFQKRIVPGDTIKACMRIVSPSRNLGQVLLDFGHLDGSIHQKLHSFIQNLANRPDGQARIAEILGKSGNTQQNQPRQTPPQRSQAPSPAPARQEIPNSPPPRQQSPVSPPPAVAQPEPPPAEPNQPATRPDPPPEEFLPVKFRGSAGEGSLGTAIPQSLSPQSNLDEILLYTRKNAASDVALAPDNPIIVRRFSKLVPVTEAKLTAADIRRIIESALSPDDLASFMESGDLELAYSISGGGATASPSSNNALVGS